MISELMANNVLFQKWTEQDLHQIIKRHNLHPDTKDVSTVIESHDKACAAILTLQTLLNQAAEGIRLSTEFRTGNPAYEQLCAAIEPHVTSGDTNDR